jgi:serine/threonine protein kinase/tetratricopeptide (TPR) repeat protein
MLCPHCGKPTEANDAYCRSCGHRLPDQSRDVAATVLTPPPPANDEEPSDATLLADTIVAPSTDSGLSGSGLSGSGLSGSSSGLSGSGISGLSSSTPSEPLTPVDPDATSLPPPEYAATLVAPSGRRATDRINKGSTTGTGKRARAAAAGKSGPLEVGQDFGPRYHIIRVLGVGGMGAVYQAWDAELSEAVAVKVIRPEIVEDPSVAQDIERRFKRELLLARQVTHKNVVRIHDLGEIGGIKYITMTYVVGSDLATVLRHEKKLPVRRALRIARGIVSGLVSAHQAGVVHRDLKPANIMVGEKDQPTIMDFGIARSSGRDATPGQPAAAVQPGDIKHEPAVPGQTVAGAIIGTVEYMSPEQAKGKPADQRSDIYSFGLILYDMLIGRGRKHKAESPLAELYGRIEKAPPSPCSIDNKIPGPVNDITMRCLAPDATKRFQTTADLLSALDQLDENGKRLPIMRRVSRRTMAAAAVLVIALLTGTFYTAKWLMAPPVVHDPVSVLIADFQTNSNDAALGLTLGQTLRRALEEASFISAYDRTRIRAGLGVQPPDKLDENAARELAVKQGLRVVLSGSIEPQGDEYNISVKAAQTVTGEVIATASNRARSKDEVLPAAARLMGRIRQALGDENSESAQLFATRTLSTSSLEVVSNYAAAVEASSRASYEQARQHYLKAVELDPKFGLGYQGLAVMALNLSRQDEAEKYINEALRYLDGMTEREKFSTRGLYYRIIGDVQQCAKEYGDMIARFPADAAGHNQRAACLVRLKRMREATEEVRVAVQILPNYVTAQSNLALFENLSGNFDAAAEVIEKMPQPDVRAILSLAYSQVGRGMLSEAADSYRKLGTMGALGVSYSASGLGDIAIYQGNFAEAIRILEQGAAADLAAKTPDRAAIKFTAIGYAHLSAGRKGPAVAAAEKALLTSKSMAVRFLAARLFVEGGAIDKAKPLAAALSAEIPAEPQTHGRILEGLIALRSGNPREAIKILSEANGIIDTWYGHYDLGRAYLEAATFLQADSEFDRCLARRGETLSLMDEGPTYSQFPPVYYFQGRVRQELKTAGFADSYRKYLEIRGASTEDPLRAEVQKRAGN